MIKIMYMIFLAAALLVTTPVAYGQQLDENLRLMEPFTGKTWESEMEGLRGEGLIKSQRRWEVIWDGKAIKYTSTTEKLNVHTEGFIFWDPDKQETAVFTLNNKGRFISGHIKEEDGIILMYGYITLDDRKLEFKNYFQFTDEGKLRDTWHRFEDGEWKAGHSVELYEKKE